MRNLLSLLVLTTVICLNGFGAEVVWNTRREGAKITAGPLKMEDGDYAQLSSGIFADVNAQSYLRLGLTERKGMDYLQRETKVRVTMTVTTYSNLGVEQTPTSQTLEVIYSPTGESGITVDAEDYRMVGTHKFKAEVTNVSVEEKIGSAWVIVQHVPSFLFLEAGFSAERYYSLDTYAVPVINASFISYSPSGVETVTLNTLTWPSTNVNTHEIELSWNYIAGAEYYDLEWTWVDNYDQTSTTIALTEQDFIRNSTRVRLGDQVYRIPQTFAKGFLVYRVRGVGRWLEDVNKDKFGRWSSGINGELTVSNWPHVITIAHEHEALKNWQYQATYAEDGKKKEVVQYFDGSLRNRQTVTRINSNNQSVVGETIYDNEGRGVIQVLPVPQENPSIQFYSGLNKNPQGQPYNFENFDVENPTTATGCTVNPAEPLSPLSGAGNYYSTTGHTTDTDWQKNVPDAEGYAFTQVEYTPDNTGRIRNQSGVGATHKIGSNHETYYYYLQPSQEELNRLFGYKVGYKQRYKKNMVVDANGQISVSYLDASGKVIATAVVGENPTNLDVLESAPALMGDAHTDLLNKQTATDSPSDDNILYSTGRFGSEQDALRVGTQLGVTKDATRYDFTYRATSSVYTEQACAGQPAKSYPYVYDLTISIKDNCGNEIFKQTDYQLGVEQIDGSTTDMLTQASAVNGIIILDAGSYTVYKELKVNEDAYNHYLADYLSTDGNPCLAVESSFATAIEADCDNSCESCLANLGTQDAFVLARAREEFGPTTTLTSLDPGALQTLQQLYASAKAECIAPCTPLPSCDSYWEMLRGDMMPDGQYGSKDPSDVLSVYNSANQLTGNWQTSTLVYKDENGQNAQVEVVLVSTGYSPAVIANPTTDANGKLWVKPNQLANVTDFLNAFQPSWADALVEFHPEYKLYKYTEEICTQTADVPMINSSSGIVNKKISSEMYDGYLSNRVFTLEQAKGTLKELYIDDADDTDDPFYGLNYIGTEPITNSSTWPIFRNDPYFKINYNAIHLLDLAGTTNYIDNTTRKYTLMKKALDSYKNGIDMYTYAVRSVIGGYDLSTDISAYDTWNEFLTVDPTILSIEKKDQIWQAYKSFYLSEKARINQLLMDMYGFYEFHDSQQSPGIYNGAIGTGELSFGIALSFNDPANSATFQNIMTDISYLWGINSFPASYTLIPIKLAMPEYNSKEIRISRLDALNDNSIPVDVQMAEMSAEADYAMWKSTGQCPLTLDLERLLNQLAQQNALIGETPWNNVSAMTPDLVTALGLTMTDVTASSANTKLKGEVTGSNLRISLTHSGFTNCIANLSQINTDFPWSSYGTTWKIYSIANSYVTPSSSIQVLVKAGTLPNGPVKEFVLTYTSCIDVNGCQANFTTNNALDGNCNKEELFEADMQHLLQKLTQSGTLYGSVSLSTLTEYTGSSLKDYFGINATWDGATGKITNTSEGKSFDLKTTFQSNVVNINGFNIVGPTVYMQYATFNTSLAIVSAFSNYENKLNELILPLNFNCSCEEMNGGAVSPGTKADYDNKLKALFNHLLVLSSQNIIPPSGYSCSELDALSPFYGVDLALRLNSPSIYSRTSTDGSKQYYPTVNNSGTYLEYSIDFLNKKTGNSICGIGLQVHMDYMASFYWNNQNTVSLSFLETHSDHTFTFNITNVVLSSNGNPIAFNDKYSCSPSFETPPCVECDPIPQTPISCNGKYLGFKTKMQTLHIGPTDMYIESMTEEHFCNMTYAYISEAYINYLDAMLVTNITDLMYLSISEFGSTPIGYSTEKLNIAVTAFTAYHSSYPTITWNTWINEVYITPLNPACPVISPTPVYPEIPLEQTPCGQWSGNISIINAQNQYGIYLNQVAESFRHKYIKGAMESVVETFEETHKEKEYHYTLYYYDRSGNLTQTVPPNGVHRMELDQAENTIINGIRSNNPGETVEDNVKAPIHTLTTDYRYNTLNQLVYQNTPDGGESRFAYDNLGRLVVSQNAKQKNNYVVEEIHGTGTYQSVLRPQFSYTLYDQLGRVVEVGEFRTTDNGYRIDEYGNFESSNLNFDINDAGWIYQPNFIREEVTRTIYDKLAGMKIPVSSTSNITVQAAFGSSYSKDNTRNRIVGVVFHSALNFDSDISVYDNGTFYDYDVHGNVKHLLQVNNDPTLVSMRQNIKHLQYEYDLVSGKVNKVYYQKGYNDQFIHRYHYDADNRITHVETSKDGFIFENDAKYFYYDHGPLARTEIGDKIVQAQDYAYTIQGWLKTVNGEELNENTMLGQDGYSTLASPSMNSGSTNAQAARDAYGYSLSYFDNDYKSANTAMLNYSASNTNLGNNLYNGNIRSMFTAISNTYENDPMAAVSPLKTHQTVYGYDQLNRIKTMNGFYRSLSEAAPAASNYNSSYSYDGNGNLLTMINRVDNGTQSGQAMDHFTYNYKANTNQLTHVNDDVTLSAIFTEDIDNQGTNNYGYDQIGQLTQDISEQIAEIKWTVTNKVKEVIYNGTRTGDKIKFDYNAIGNRIAKYETKSNITKSTYYVLDAQGNAMSTYSHTTEAATADKLYLIERSIYGSSRLGMEQRYDEIGTVIIDAGDNWETNYYDGNYHINLDGTYALRSKNEIGDKRYELANHLGNVLNVVSDRKLPSSVDNASVAFYRADVVSYSDYFAFGMTMPGRHGDDEKYRYGFNGMEKDDEIKGNGNSYTTEFRHYDPRIGRWLSVDKMFKNAPNWTPYRFAFNNPIKFIDQDGNFEIDPEFKRKYPKTALLLENADKLYNNQALPPEVQEALGAIDAQKVFDDKFRAAFDKNSTLSPEQIKEVLTAESGPLIRYDDLDFDKLVNGKNEVELDDQGNKTNVNMFRLDGKQGVITIDNDLADVLEFELKDVKNGIPNTLGGFAGKVQDKKDAQASFKSFMYTLFHETVHYGRNKTGTGNDGETDYGDVFENEGSGGNVPRVKKDTLKGN